MTTNHRECISRLQALMRYQRIPIPLHVFGYWQRDELREGGAHHLIEACALRSCAEVVSAIASALNVQPRACNPSDLVYELLNTQWISHTDINSNESLDEINDRRVIVLLELLPEHAEIITRMAAHLHQITFVIASESSLPCWYEISGGGSRLPFYIPPLHQEELIRKLVFTLDAPQKLVEFLVGGFKGTYNREDELRALVQLMQPIFASVNEDVLKLKPFLLAMEERFAMNAISTVHLRSNADGVELPTPASGLTPDAKHVIIASFVASHNHASMDMRVFANSSRKRKAAKKLTKTGSKLSRRLVGPRAFEIDRMLAILKRLHPEAFVLHNLSSHIATLMSMNILAFGSSSSSSSSSSADDLLHVGKMCCNLDIDAVNVIANSIGIRINDYLLEM